MLNSEHDHVSQTGNHATQDPDSITTQHRDPNAPRRPRAKNLMPLHVDAYLIMLLLAGETYDAMEREPGKLFFDPTTKKPESETAASESLVATLVDMMEDRYNDSLSPGQAHAILFSLLRRDRNYEGALFNCDSQEEFVATFTSYIEAIEGFIDLAVIVVSRRDAEAAAAQGDQLLPGMPGAPGAGAPGQMAQGGMPIPQELQQDPEALANIARGTSTDR